MVHNSGGKVALCFPGQLSKVPDGLAVSGGGGYSLPHPFLEMAWERAGFDLISFFFQREEEDRCINLKLQVATYLLSTIAFDRFRQKRGGFDLITEHSMGIYAALVAAGSLTFEQGLDMTKGIGLIIEKGGLPPGGMATVIGLDAEAIKGICAQFAGRLFVANVNGSRHFVLSGETSSVQQCMGLALRRGAVSVQRLPISVPLHSPLAESLRSEVESFIEGFDIKQPAIPLASHWGGRRLKDPEEIKLFLVEELYRPVDWEGCVQQLIAEGVNCFIEMGTQETLTKLIRWIDRDVKALSYGGRDVL